MCSEAFWVQVCLLAWPFLAGVSVGWMGGWWVGGCVGWLVGWLVGGTRMPIPCRFICNI